MSIDLIEPAIDTLPENWRIKKLSQIARTYAGGTPLRSNPLYYNGNIPWVKSGEVDNSNIYETEEYVTELAVKETATRFIEKNSVLIALYGATAGKVGRLRVRACCNQAVLAVNTIDENANNDFIYFYLKLSAEELIKMSQGSGQPNLSKGIIDKLSVKLPPLPEQQKIAEILSTVDEKIDAIDQRIAQTQELKKGLMQQLLTKGIGHTQFKDSPLGEIPVGWEVVKIQELLDEGKIISHLDGNHGGLYPKADEFIDEGVPYISANCFLNNRVDFSRCKHLSMERSLLFKKGVAKNGDVLFAHNATVGPVAFLETDLDFVILSTTATYFRLDNKTIDAKYWLYFLSSPSFKNQYEKVMGQSTRNQVPITMQRTFFSILPSFEEQKDISEIISAVDQKLQIQKDRKSEYQELKKGLMQQLLTGKIRVKV